jgi:hypothetical protein
MGMDTDHFKACICPFQMALPLLLNSSSAFYTIISLTVFLPFLHPPFRLLFSYSIFLLWQTAILGVSNYFPLCD